VKLKDIMFSVAVGAGVGGVAVALIAGVVAAGVFAFSSVLIVGVVAAGVLAVGIVAVGIVAVGIVAVGIVAFVTAFAVGAIIDIAGVKFGLELNAASFIAGMATTSGIAIAAVL